MSTYKKNLLYLIRKYRDYPEKISRSRREEEEKKKSQNQILQNRVKLLCKQFKKMKMKKSTGVYALTVLKSDIKDLQAGP